MSARAKRRTPKGSLQWLATRADFERLYDHHGSELYGFFIRQTYDQQASLDLTAETFAQAFAGRLSFRGTGDAEAASWLFGIARNLLSGFIRKGYADQQLVRRLSIDVPTATDEFERVLEMADADALRPMIGERLAGLSTDQQEAIQLRVVDELSVADIADRLGVSHKVVRMRVARALAKLATQMDKAVLIHTEAP